MCALACSTAACAEPEPPPETNGVERAGRETALAQTTADAPDAQLPVASYPRLEPDQIGPVVRVASGYGLAESPVWDTCAQHLLFTDVDRSVIHQLDAEGKISTFASDTHYANGMALDYDGSLVLAQMGGGRGGKLVRRAPDGRTTVLAERDPAGRVLHTVDDLTIRADGTIYFTDADFPHGRYTGFDLGPLPLYFLRPGARPELVRGPSVTGPNGVELSPDEKTLYLSSYFGEQILKYAVAADGSLTRVGAFATRIDKSDSFCLDAAGNLYAGSADGLIVYRADGTRVKLLSIRSADGTTNCTFGGADGKTLYITSFESLWKVEGMPIPGNDWVKHEARRSCPG